MKLKLQLLKLNVRIKLQIQQFLLDLNLQRLILLKLHPITQLRALILIINNLISRIRLEFENQNQEDQKVEFQDERNQNLKIIIDQSLEILKSQQNQHLLSQNDLQPENLLKIFQVQFIITIAQMLKQVMKQLQPKDDFKLQNMGIRIKGKRKRELLKVLTMDQLLHQLQLNLIE